MDRLRVESDIEEEDIIESDKTCVMTIDQDSTELCSTVELSRPVDLSNNNSALTNNNHDQSHTLHSEVRKLSFSVENILDPNKFTGKTPLFQSGGSTKNLFSPHLSTHPTSNFRFSFKDIHGTKSLNIF